MNKKDLITLAKMAIYKRGALAQGASKYIPEIVESAGFAWGELSTLSTEEFKKQILLGADNWAQYSAGACSLVYNEDIARRLFRPWVVKDLAKRGYVTPRGENMIEIQARALEMAGAALVRAFKALKILEG